MTANDRRWNFRCMRRNGSGGFTLVELLVVMTLLSLVVLALGSALRTMAQTQERLDASLARTDDLRVTDMFLRRILGRIAAHKKPGLLSQGENPFLFRGTAGAIDWIGVMPAGYGSSGRHFLQLNVEAEGGESALVLRYAPWKDDAIPPVWSSAQRHVIAKPISAIQLEYQNAAVEPPQWTPVWNSPDALPERVRVTLTGSRGAWPAVVVPMWQLRGTSALSNVAVFGGTR